MYVKPNCISVDGTQNHSFLLVTQTGTLSALWRRHADEELAGILWGYKQSHDIAHSQSNLGDDNDADES